MVATPFDQDNMDFSLRARKVAIENIYPIALGEGTAIDTTETTVDYDSGVDLIWLREDGTTVSVQERFRREKYAHFREVTATDKNLASGRQGDYHKLEADVYSYGYFDGTEFSEVILVDIDKLKNGDIQPETQYFPRKQQQFLCFPFSEILERGYEIYHRD